MIHCADVGATTMTVHSMRPLLHAALLPPSATRGAERPLCLPQMDPSALLQPALTLRELPPSFSNMRGKKPRVPYVICSIKCLAAGRRQLLPCFIIIYQHRTSIIFQWTILLLFSRTSSLSLELFRFLKFNY